MNRLSRLICLICMVSLSLLACTNWICMPNSNDMGATILHKNRDSGKGEEKPVRVRINEATESRLRCIYVCDHLIFNEKGFAILNNYLSKAKDGRTGKEMMSATLMRTLAEKCSTVPQAIALLRKIQATQDTCTTNLLITDGRHAAMIETTAARFAVRECKSGFMVHTNHNLFSELKEYCGSRPDKTATENRLKLTTALLQDTIRKRGVLHMEDLLRISRYHDDANYPDQSPFRKATVCAADYIAQGGYPVCLNTIYVQPGPTCCTLAIPIPLCCTKVPEPLASGEMGHLSYAIRAAGGPDHACRKFLAEAEQRIWQEYLHTRAQARRLLLERKEAEAADLMQTLLERQTAQALALLKEALARLQQTEPLTVPVASTKNDAAS